LCFLKGLKEEGLFKKKKKEKETGLCQHPEGKGWILGFPYSQLN
jgi:hypothetical protein